MDRNVTFKLSEIKEALHNRPEPVISLAEDNEDTYSHQASDPYELLKIPSDLAERSVFFGY